MISTARFLDAPSQQPRRLQHHANSYPDSSQLPRLDPTSHPQRSFPPSSDFSFEFPLTSSLLDPRVKHSQHPARQHEPLEFSLSAFPEPPRNYYEPATLQIPSQSHPTGHAPSPYIPTATSTLPPQSFPDFHHHPPSDSHSLSPSPLDRNRWGDHSSSSLSVSPHNANNPTAPELVVDSRLAQIPYSIGLQSPQPPLQLPVPSVPSNARPAEPHPSTANGHPSPESGSSDYGPEVPHSKIGPNGLAEDQPPTAQGKMRTRVYVACLQCRSRKIRCDGGKPKCLKCSRRSSECQYDSAPKRRGPDKKPGARQRTSKKAKAAKEGLAQDAESDSWGHVFKGQDENDQSGPRKRRKSSDGLLSWATNTAAGPGRGAPVSSAENPLQPRGLPGLPIGYGAVPEIHDGVQAIKKIDTHTYDNYVSSKQLIPATPHDRIPFTFDVSGTGTTGNDQVHDTVQPNRRQEYVYPVSAFSNVPYFPPAQIHSVDEEDQQQENHKREIGSEPSLEFSRKTWWDNLLAMYSPESDRSKTALQVQADLQFLFKTSNYFLSFFNVPLFFSTFCNPVERDKMQPSLVLAGLAIATFMRSSEINGGHAGRLRALWLRDAAQSALEASFNARWIEPALAQAAWLLVLFEASPHPQATSERHTSAMVMLDSIIRSLGLMSLDASDPDVSVFSPRGVPAIASAPTPPHQKGCSCNTLTLAHNSRLSLTHTPLWAATSAWNPEWSVAEIRKEESRRLCWSTLQLAASHTAYAAAFSHPMPDFFCVQPANYVLLFPGESLMQAPSFHLPQSSKETVWALYSRAMLLWNSCLRMRGNDVSDDERAVFAVGAWIESTAIEEALDAHTCGCEQAFMFQGREFLFITRMCISYEFRRFIPYPESDVNGLFNRKKAMAWLVRQSSVAKRIMHGLHTVTGHKDNMLAQRPFFLFWFMSLVARSLSLWSCDQSLLIALDVCKAFLPPIEYLSCLWPCPKQQTAYQTLHARVIQACNTARIQPPPPPNFDMMAPGSPPVTVI